jgi:hypothetical protein
MWIIGMRSSRVFLLVCACLLYLLQAQAQVPLTGAGKGSPGGGVTFSVTYESQQDTTTTTATQNFGTMSYGTSPSVVVAMLCWSGTTTVSGITINGVSGSQVSGAYTTVSGINQSADAWYVVAPGGSSGNVTVTFAGALSSATVTAWVSLYNIQTATTTPSAANQSNSNNTSSLNAAVTIPSGGAAIASYCSWIGEPFNTWTNATSDHTSATGNLSQNVGHNSSSSGSTTITGSTTGSNSATLGIVAWNP